MTDILCIGNSHTNAILSAARQRAECGSMKNPVAAINLNKSGIDKPLLKHEASYSLDRRLVEMITRAADGWLRPGLYYAGRFGSDRNRVIVSTVGGNMHNILALIQHERPFDVIIPDRSDLPEDKEAELIPYLGFLSALRKRVELQLRLIEAIAFCSSNCIAHIESPPPIADDEFIRSNIEQRFAMALENTPLASKWLRLKIWHIHSAIFRDACQAIGIEFLAAPSESMDEAGFMEPMYYPAANCTHANRPYGELVLNQLDALVANHQLEN